MAFPLELLDVPQVERLTAVQYGIFARLVVSYWKSGLAIPESPYAIARLANTDLGTIGRHREAVLACLRAVMPKLQDKYQKRLVLLDSQRMQAAHIRGLKLLKISVKRMANESLFNDENELGVPVLPVKNSLEKSMYHPGKHDPIARQAALNAQKSPKETLTDG